jgi:hypothetical protein
VVLFYFDLNLKLYLKRFEKKQKKKKTTTYLLTFLARRPSEGLLSRACPCGPAQRRSGPVQPSPAAEPAQPRVFSLFR